MRGARGMTPRTACPAQGVNNKWDLDTIFGITVLHKQTWKGDPIAFSLVTLSRPAVDLNRNCVVLGDLLCRMALRARKLTYLFLDVETMPDTDQKAFMNNNCPLHYASHEKKKNIREICRELK